MIEDAFNKMRQLIILSSEDRRNINEIASIQRRVTSLQKQYAANQFQFGIFAFFFGNDGEVEINNNQLNEDIKEQTLKVLLENILQEEYKGQWIEKVQLYYEGELLSLN